MCVCMWKCIVLLSLGQIKWKPTQKRLSYMSKCLIIVYTHTAFVNFMCDLCVCSVNVQEIIRFIGCYSVDYNLYTDTQTL